MLIANPWSLGVPLVGKWVEKGEGGLKKRPFFRLLNEKVGKRG